MGARKYSPFDEERDKIEEALDAGPGMLVGS